MGERARQVLVRIEGVEYCGLARGCWRGVCAGESSKATVIDHGSRIAIGG
jgi:hypothetical protein